MSWTEDISTPNTAVSSRVPYAGRETGCRASRRSRSRLVRQRHKMRNVASGYRPTTEFALDVEVVGATLDATIIARQRRKELERQFDYLERAVEQADGAVSTPG